MEFTLKIIEEIVDKTKDLTQEQLRIIAYQMPITASSIYVIKMKAKYGITIYL